MHLAKIPVLVLILSFVVLWFAARIGAFIRTRTRPLKEEERQDFYLVLAATLTLLGLLIGFTFSMAVNRYDLRKNYEEAEANAIGTELAQGQITCPPADAAKVRSLLKLYIDARILFLHHARSCRAGQGQRRHGQSPEPIAGCHPPFLAQPNPVTALVVSGMNDALNSQSYTQAAWWNRIPVEAWWLMIAIAVSCNILIGYGVKSTVRGVFLILPIAVSISFLLISDIDSPPRRRNPRQTAKPHGPVAVVAGAIKIADRVSPSRFIARPTFGARYYWTAPGVGVSCIGKRWRSIRMFNIRFKNISGNLTSDKSGNISDSGLHCVVHDAVFLGVDWGVYPHPITPLEKC